MTVMVLHIAPKGTTTEKKRPGFNIRHYQETERL